MLKTTKIALAAGVAAAAFATTGGANAQSVEELIQRLEAQEAQIEALKGQVEELGDRPEALVVPNRDGIEIEVSGRINQALLFADNGDQDQLFIVDSDSSGSRFGLRSSGRLGDFRARARIEVTAEINTTDEINFSDDPSGEPGAGSGEIDDDFLDVRQAHWELTHRQFGGISIGFSNTATQDVSQIAVGGLGLLLESDVDDLGGELQFEGIGDQGEVDDFFDNLDGDRETRLRLDTPDFFGFSAAVAFIDRAPDDGADFDGDLQIDAAVYYAGEFAGGWEVEAAGGWRDEPDPEDGSEAGADVFHGSAGILSPFGVSLSGGGGVRLFGDEAENSGLDISDEGETFFYGQLGYRNRFFSFGETRFGVDIFFGEGIEDIDEGSGEGGFDDDSIFIGSVETFAVGAGIIQQVSPLGSEFYVGIRNFSIEFDTEDDPFIASGEIDDPDDLFLVVAGARVRF